MANDSEAPRTSAGQISTPASDRAERLLACVGKACNHDLSNQMVALQGMLHLVLEEEQEKEDKDNGWIDERLEMGIEEVRKLNKNVLPGQKMLMKMGAC